MLWNKRRRHKQTEAFPSYHSAHIFWQHVWWHVCYLRWNRRLRICLHLVMYIMFALGRLGWEHCISGLLSRDQKVFLGGAGGVGLSKASDKNGGLFEQTHWVIFFPQSLPISVFSEIRPGKLTSFLKLKKRSTAGTFTLRCGYSSDMIWDTSW